MVDVAEIAVSTGMEVRASRPTTGRNAGHTGCSAAGEGAQGQW